MNKYEFLKLIELLKSVYGSDKYPLPVISIWYEELKNVNPIRLEKAFKRVIANHPNPRFAPTIEKVELTLADIRVEAHEKQKEEFKGNAVSIEELTSFFAELKNNVPAIR